MCMETSSKPFLIFKESSVKKESEELCLMILSNFGSFAITYLIQAGCFKHFIFQ